MKRIRQKDLRWMASEIERLHSEVRRLKAEAMRDKLIAEHARRTERGAGVPSDS